MTDTTENTKPAPLDSSVPLARYGKTAAGIERQFYEDFDVVRQYIPGYKLTGKAYLESRKMYAPVIEVNPECGCVAGTIILRRILECSTPEDVAELAFREGVDCTTVSPIGIEDDVVCEMLDPSGESVYGSFRALEAGLMPPGRREGLLEESNGSQAWLRAGARIRNRLRKEGLYVE